MRMVMSRVAVPYDAAVHRTIGHAVHSVPCAPWPCASVFGTVLVHRDA